MASLLVGETRTGKEVYTGKETCKQKCMELLEGAGLPKGLLPLDEIEECGIDWESGQVWIRQKKKVEVVLKATGKPTQYSAEITAFVEKNKMKKVTGVKAKELLLWIPITEITVPPKSPDQIYFKSSTGIGKTFPFSYFELDPDQEKLYQHNKALEAGSASSTTATAKVA